MKTSSASPGFPPRARRFLRPLVLTSAVVGLLGCDRLQGSGALVNVFATHHASPEDGTFPLRGEDDQPRVFMAEDGWQVTLAESYVTIASVTVVSCSGSAHPLKMFWGPCPEDLRVKDLQTLTVAGVKVPPGDYCHLEIEYAPYEMPVIDEEAETRHVVPSNEEVDGVTVFLRGIAEKGEDSVPFVLKNGETFTVDIDLAGPDGPGEPMNVQPREDFPKELTISKTYDRFFDGVDFATFDEEAIEADLDQILADQTRVAAGQIIPPESFED